MQQKLLRFFLSFSIFVLFFSTVYSQSQIVFDSFSDHTLSGWYWGGNITMKYSHETDNLENGYAEVFSKDANVTAGSFVGLIKKDQKLQIAQYNIFSIMLQGTSSDVSATVELLYDKNNDAKFDEGSDVKLQSKVISLNYSGWKEIHLNITEDDFKIISKSKSDDFSILESEAMGIQVVYQTGKSFTTSKLMTGIALISERPNKELKQESANNITDNSDESFYNLKNYPNPFNPETNISFFLKNTSNVKITVYDRLGREVTVLQDGALSEGEHSVIFNASSLPSGIYFYRIKTSEKTEVRKMVLAK